MMTEYYLSYVYICYLCLDHFLTSSAFIVYRSVADAVTVVVYNMMVTFVSIGTVGFTDILLGVASFFVVSLGGLGIGLVMGILTAVITKYTENTRGMTSEV